ncbi:diguanylate cyclase (GGDEF)-like protein/PAS domain S-box-containing protein [Actimicrobium sp. GrIS 1.19]|uniref:putative bifunctional diguanylate cyclase/phosphodiesterase n=1 Tax=Actimicrobium sp. GrIS 1.19 TaxID=3071708 RepID=UPI002E0A533B|nr:diguanylate cyclase (GGDEF)-like protein/PAS domain S-box-containing protein [Actimicrobium sp. GrIS 1.19]
MNAPQPTVLIVDDQAINCEILEAFLLPERYRTITAHSGKAALEAVAQHAPDLILLDVMMPDLNGYEVAAILKGNPATANIPIIMVTARSDHADRLQGLNAGAEDILAKPVERIELWLRVRNLLRMKALSDFLQNHSNILEQQVQMRAVDLQRFRSAMDASADAIMLIDCATLRFIEVNATACRMSGYSHAELMELGPVGLAGTTSVQLDLLYESIVDKQGGSVMAEGKLWRKDDASVPVEVQRHAHRSGTEWIIVSVVRDISERKRAEHHLRRLAHYDALTGLPNRRLFDETLQNTLASATKSNEKVAVLHIDVDQLRSINDTLGRVSGDELLRQLSKRLVRTGYGRDLLGRLGGDEFGMIVPVTPDCDSAALAAAKVREQLRAPFELRGQSTEITVSIGITVHPDDATDPETLLKYADIAMQQAKQAGCNTVRFFTPEMNSRILDRLEMESALRTAIEREEFVLHYQPKVELSTNTVVGVEALLRWQRPGYGLVSPVEFIPVLEETGMIVQVGRWVIQAACRQIAQWLENGVGPMQVSVNVAGRQFIEGDLEADVATALRDTAIDPALLELELTEGSLMVNTERTMTIMHNLKAKGVQISIDDFGTGYSSLAYLRRFPLDKLKIDIAFIRDITTNEDDATIAVMLIRMAHSLKLIVVAEGVESPAQADYLRKHHCDQMQGFLFSKPLAASDLERLLDAHPVAMS